MTTHAPPVTRVRFTLYVDIAAGDGIAMLEAALRAQAGEPSDDDAAAGADWHLVSSTYEVIEAATTLGALAVGDRVLRPFFETVETVAKVRRINQHRVEVTFASGASWTNDPAYRMTLA